MCTCTSLQKASSLDNANAEMDPCALGKTWNPAFGGNQDSDVGAPNKEPLPLSYKSSVHSPSQSTLWKPEALPGQASCMGKTLILRRQ